MLTDNKTANSVTRPETISINSSSTTGTSTNNSIDTNKLLSKKQQEQPTAKKQTPLEKYLDEYAEKLENKSPEELQKEKEQLERQKKKSLIIPIIFAILALIALITACILLPLMAAIAIAIPFAIGAITFVASGIIDYNIINKKIDRVNVKKSQLSLQEKTQLRGNNKALGTSIKQTTEKNIANNNKKNANNINNNLKNQDNTNNKNNNQNIQNDNKNDKNNVISNNVTANKKNNIIGNNIKNDNGNINNNKNKITTNNVDTKQNQATVASDSSNNIVNSKVATSNDKDTNIKSAMFDKNKINNQINQQQNTANSILQTKNKTTNDEQEAEEIRKDTLQSILNGTLDLYNNRPKNEEEYKKCREAVKNAKTQTEKAKSQQQMIKYEIWSQLSSTDQENYDQRIKKGKTPEKILKENISNNTNWQIDVYNKHLENEEQKNQSWLSAINPVNWLKTEPTIEEKRDAVKTAILGRQQKNGIKLSGVSQQTGNNYDSGAIKSKNMTTQANQIN